MDGRGRGTGGASDGPDTEPRQDRGPLLVALGWIMIVAGLIWVWMVFFAHQGEVGLWIAAVVCGLGYVVQRAGSKTS